MGGMGSGRIFFNKKLTVLDGLTLNINNMGFTRERDFIEAWKNDKFIDYKNGYVRWTRKSDSGKIATAEYNLSGQGDLIKLTLIYTKKEEAINEEISISSTVHKGNGLRFWFLCPLIKNHNYCQNRVSKLYLPNGAKYFGCRECYELTYESCQNSRKLGSFYGLMAEQMGCTVEELKVALKYLNIL